MVMFGRAHSDLKTLIGEDESGVRRGEFGGRHCGGLWCVVYANWQDGTPRRWSTCSRLITRDRSLGIGKFLVGRNVGLERMEKRVSVRGYVRLG